MGHLISLLAQFPISGCAYLSLQLEQRRWQKRYHSCQGDGYVHRRLIWRSTSTRAWGVDLACGHLGPHGDCRSSCCLSKNGTEPGTRAQRRSWTRTAPSYGQSSCAQQRGLVIVHGLIALFLGVIPLATILLVVGLGALWVLVIASRAIVVSIVLMMIVGSAITTVVLVASMVVAIFATMMLMVAWLMARDGRKMSRFLFLWLLLVLGDLLENASPFVGCLTLLKESDHLEWVRRHHLVQVCKLVLVRLRLREEDLLTLLLHHWVLPSFDGGSHP
jgi:hypothetical protein